MKTVIIFYSRTRKTSIVAKTLAKMITTDCVEVIDLKDRMGPLNYLKSTFDAIRENKTLIKPETVELGVMI